MRNAGLEEAQTGIKISRSFLKGMYRKIIRICDPAEKDIGLKLNIQKTKIMASGPINSWQIDGETVETVSDFIFWGSKITANGDCSHEIKRRLLLWKESCDQSR